MSPNHPVLAVAVVSILWIASPADAIDWSVVLHSGGDVSRLDPPVPRKHRAGQLTGAHFGASLSASRGVLGVRTGLEFVEGTEISGDVNPIQFDALQMPVLLELRARSIGPVRPTLLAGIALSHILAVRSSAPPSSRANQDLVATDVGAVLGAGLEVRRVGAEARYSWGLRDLVPDRPGSRTRVFSTGLRFRF
jgi:hypothetical protein